MAAATVASPLDWRALQSLLGKKASFEDATRQACSALESQPAQALAAPACRDVLARARTLLRSRYSTRPFWLAGRQLFSAAQQAASRGGDSAFAAQLAEWVAECNAFLGEEPEGSGSTGGGDASDPETNSTSRAYLFEGQLSGQQEPPPRPPGLLDLLSGALGQQLAAAAAAAQPQGGDGDSQPQGQQPGQPQQPSPEMLEAIERELDAIAVQIMEETGQDAAAQRAPPPASKRVVASLPVEALTAERLRQLGGAGVARCPVCMEELAEGEEVQLMPCSSGHVFHPTCLRPWLEQHNSCPTCRHELPTDDTEYERRKEREQVEAEERRGAENACTHNDFLYI